jgi:hypothetical protein
MKSNAIALVRMAYKARCIPVIRPTCSVTRQVITSVNPCACYRMEQEFEDFFLHCQKITKSNQNEIEKILKPLRQHLWKKLMQKWLKVIVIVAAICCATYCIEALNWYVCAIGRILMIKCLPLWNWTYLENANCLISNPAATQSKSQQTSSSFNDKDCRTCEHFGEVYYNFRFLKS